MATRCSEMVASSRDLRGHTSEGEQGSGLVLKAEDQLSVHGLPVSGCIRSDTKGSEILGLADAQKASGPVAYLGFGAVSPLPTALCTLSLREPTQALVFPPPGPQLSLHLQPSPLFQNAGMDRQRPAGPLRPDSSQAGPEAVLFLLTSVNLSTLRSPST